jgi:ketosteroid isomerase-like protein
MAFDATSTIHEVRVEGSMAWMWSHLEVTATPAGAAPIKRAGHTLTVFRKVNGSWLLARDANLLVKV